MSAKLATLAAVMFYALSSVSAARSEVPAVQADKADPNAVQWRFRSEFADGRRFLSDGSLFLESRYVAVSSMPEKSVPQANAQRLLDSKTDHEFGLADLTEAGGHFPAPGRIQLNRKYVDLLRGTPLGATVMFRAKGPGDPILILDGQKVVGVVMPMKTAS